MKQLKAQQRYEICRRQIKGYRQKKQKTLQWKPDELVVTVSEA